MQQHQHATTTAHKNIDRLVSTSEVETKQTIAIRLKNFLLRRPTKESIKLKGIYKEVVFGSSIQSICEREKSKIPRFIRECMLAVESRGLSVDGIYRVSGNMASIQKLRNMVDMNEYYDLSDSMWDIHTITGALKLFFRELSEPLFTYALYDDFIKALHNLNQIKELIKKLPVTNGKTLKALFRHLDIVLQHSKDNRMQSQGLAIVFGPTLLWSDRKVADANMAFDIVQRGQLVEFIINNCRAIFG
ncbi:hypothetical protein HELRODRAFT_72679 [Helobdella robusta]|uniref:Rho-GAP domain-containing protein n=1 Tax=Helobdella robusta TaxID=6412 RepID=T1G137_HELRO|nr:hypothetical protein HELRODRAFT_72679 [Helobdella robusta]ESO11090.1 hypothetical protein HELRODRAFT_72679 [Helobdella robusta]